MTAPLETLLLSAEQIAEFGERLRADGFRVGTQQLVQAQQLLVRLAAAGLLPDRPAQLASHLGPIFCGTPEEQRRFPDLFKDWLPKAFQDSPVPSPAPDRRQRRRETTAPNRPKWRWILGGGVLALFLTASLVAAQFWWPRKLPGIVLNANDQPAAGAWINFQSAHFKVSDDGRFTLPFRRSDLPQTLTVTLDQFEQLKLEIKPLLPARLDLKLVATPPPTDKPTNVISTVSTNVTYLPGSRQPALTGVQLQRVIKMPRSWRQHAELAAYASIPFALLLLWWGIRRAWRRFRGEPQLQRLRTETPASRREVRLGGGTSSLLPGLGVNELGRELRRRRRVHSRELDTPATLTATLANGGLLSPVFGSRVEPNYLVLIDRASLHDHQAEIAALVVKTLLLGNVSVERYYYDGDPGFCRRADDRTGEATAQTVTLEELAARLPEHRLLLFSDGAGFFDGFTGQPAAWVHLLAAWDDKAILTPEPPRHWGRREWAIEKLGFLLLPISRAGLTALGDFFRERPVLALAPAGAHQTPAPAFARNPARWLERESPAPEQVTRLCDELKNNLRENQDDTGFHWLCACAVYPEVHWGFTIRLGASLVPDERKFERLLPRLARLIWLRESYLPDWFRAALLARLPEPQSQTVRKVLTEILAQAGTAPDKTIALHIATDEPARKGGLRARWQAFCDWLRLRQAVQNAAPDSPMADHVFVRFMSGRRDPALLLPVPQTLLNLLYPQGASLYGLRGSVALTVAAILSLAILFGLETRVELPSVESVAFSPDGRWVVTGSDDNTARLWDLTAADPAARPVVLKGHEGSVYAVAFSPDGRWVVTGSADDTARLWDLTAADPAAQPVVLKGHADWVHAVAVSPDSRWVATGSLDNTARLWDLTAADPAAQPIVLKGHTYTVYAVAVSPDSRWVVTGSGDSTARLWDLHASDPAAQPIVLKGHADWVLAVAVSPDGRWVVTGSTDNTARLWDLTAADPSAQPVVLKGHEGSVYAVAVSPDSRTLATASIDGTVRLWSLSYSTGAEALLIGCDYTRYGGPYTLTNPLRDTRAIAQVLNQRFGFGVTTLENPSLEQVQREFARLTASLAPDDTFLLLLAGNSWTGPDQRFRFLLNPQAINDPKATEQNLTESTVAKFLASVRARQALLIADAKDADRLARSAPVGTNSPGGKTRTILTSASRDQIPSDGTPGQGSPFANALVAVLSTATNSISGTQLSQALTYQMSREKTVVIFGNSADRQRPTYGPFPAAGHTTGDFLFPPPLPVTPTPPVTAQPITQGVPPVGAKVITPVFLKTETLPLPQGATNQRPLRPETGQTTLTNTLPGVPKK